MNGLRDVPRAAVLLVLGTAAYNVGEGAISIWAGIAAGSVVLVSFGADSYLEVAAAGVVLWRLAQRDEEAAERAEGTARRFIGLTFLLLAAAIVLQSAIALVGRSGSEGSLLGLGLLLLSVTLMPVISLAKLRTAAREGLPSLAAEARETIACSYLSLTALVGVAATVAFGWWWLDAVAALALLPWVIREGIEGLRGEACFEGLRPCFCKPCFFGLRDCSPAGDGCVPICC